MYIRFECIVWWKIDERKFYLRIRWTIGISYSSMSLFAYCFSTFDCTDCVYLCKFRHEWNPRKFWYVWITEPRCKINIQGGLPLSIQTIPEYSTANNGMTMSCNEINVLLKYCKKKMLLKNMWKNIFIVGSSLTQYPSCVWLHIMLLSEG